MDNAFNPTVRRQIVLQPVDFAVELHMHLYKPEQAHSFVRPSGRLGDHSVCTAVNRIGDTR